ncbi:MAG: hypothetical protein J4G09_14555 [Proteobacteria bacterium]|nr:hypothetical protein [Pseudomonadota bacterium]
MVYLPVICRILVWTLRYRRGAVFTAANPGMPAGGFVGAGKAAILGELAGAGPALARFAPLPPGPGRLQRALRFMREHGLDYPVVVKPDAGERGRGVSIARDRDALAGALDSLDGAALVQEYVDGPEFGLFYARRPGEERGRLFSITEKILPEVRGDGLRTLEQLILADPRAVAMSGAYFANHAANLQQVVPEGRGVRLVSLGTHSRGAIFRDGERHRTPALEAELERVSRCFEGFFFGRYDVRSPSVEALRAGEFKVLELNGVTSEATHIYDRRYGLCHAYRVLFEQWRLAFEIGARNAERGARVFSLGELWRALRDSRRGGPDGG